MIDLKKIDIPDPRLSKFQENTRDFAKSVKEDFSLFRVPKPGFQYNSDTEIIIPFQNNKTAIFKIGDRIFPVESDLVLNVTRSGAGGLNTGISVAASTVYYLYACIVDNQVSLIADTSDPTVGPSGFQDWTYLGSFPTNGSADVVQFISSRGFLISGENLFNSGGVSTTSTTKKTIVPCPITVRQHYGFVVIDGTVTDGWGDAFGYDHIASGIEAYLSVSGKTVENAGFIPAGDGANIYMAVSNSSNSVTFISLGWIEDPSEWK